MKLLLAILVAAFSLGCVASQPDKDVMRETIRKMDSQLDRQYGLTIKKISVLMQESASAYQPKWYLEQKGYYSLLIEMERDGFLEMEEVSNLPDGSNAGGSLVRYIATDKGAEVISSLDE